MTIVSTAVRNDLDVSVYLKDVLDKILAGSTDWESLRADRWKESHPQAIAATPSTANAPAEPAAASTETAPSASPYTSGGRWLWCTVTNVFFPWRADVPGGTQRCTNVTSYKALWLPKQSNGRAMPIVWFHQNLRNPISGAGYDPAYGSLGTVVQLYYQGLAAA